MNCSHGDVKWCGEHGPGGAPPGFEARSNLVPAPYPPGRYGSVAVLFDENYGGFLGFEFAGGLYSSEDTLPRAARDELRGGAPVCRNGHSRAEYGLPCRRCARERSAARRVRHANA